MQSGNSFKKNSVLFAILLVCISQTTFAATIYVDDDASPGGDGESWATAYKYLQDALGDVESGDQILVAQGIYKPDVDTAHSGGSGSRYATFQLINGLAIYGGFPSGGGQWHERDPNAYETILSGDLMGNDGPNFANNGENSEHVVTGIGTDETAVLDGFTITAGNANRPWLFADHGGGMYNQFSSPTVSNCTFSGNSAEAGGGMFNNMSSPRLINCTFSSNSASWDGGGMNNDASNPTLINCTFSTNSANHGGGGVYNSQSNLVVINCSFSGNSTNWIGGGMANNRSSPMVVNCTFSGNLARWNGGGMCNFGVSRPTLTNCILWSNRARYGSQIFNDWIDSATVSYSDVQGGWSGTGNIDSDPLFIDASSGDLRLLPDSPCIDAGDNTAVPPDTLDLDGDGNTVEPIPWDLDGLPRFVDGDANGTDIVDMGAYEFRLAIGAIVDIQPETLNLQSKGVITAFIELPEPYSVEDIDLETVECEGAGAIRGTIANDTLIVKFECRDLQDIEPGQEVELLVTGELTDGTVFEGTDVIRVIDKGNEK